MFVGATLLGRPSVERQSSLNCGDEKGAATELTSPLFAGTC